MPPSRSTPKQAKLGSSPGFKNASIMSFVTKSPRNLSESSESPAKALTNLSTAIQTTKEVILTSLSFILISIL